MSPEDRNRPSDLRSDPSPSPRLRTPPKLLPLAVALIVAAALMAWGLTGAAVHLFRATYAQPTEDGAKQFASYWLERLQAGDLLTGWVLTLPPDERPPDEADLRRFIASDPTRKRALEGFHEERLVRMLRPEADSRFSFTRTERFDRSRGEATLWYRVETTDPVEQRRRIRVELHLHYDFEKAEGQGGWWIRRVVFPLSQDYVLRDVRDRSCPSRRTPRRHNRLLHGLPSGEGRGDGRWRV